MLGSLQRLLLKLCDPRNSVPVSDSSPCSSKVAVVEKLPPWSKVVKKPPQSVCPPIGRHDTPSNHSHNVKSPINQLPNELLAEIFTTVCHADSDQFLGDRQRHKKTTPLILGGVCAHWRRVVQSSPQIWSHLSLCLSTPWARYETQVSLLREWLAHSGVCPLVINLVFQNEDEWTNMLANELIELLAQQAYRWKSINIVLPESWYPLFDCIKHNLNQLTTLSTQPLWADCGLSPSKRKKLALFEHAPLLNDLHLNGYYLTDVFLGWSQLTRLTLQHVYLDECFYALPRTPNLTWCRIYTILVNDVNRTIIDPERPILLDKLNKFIVYSAPCGDLLRLLSFLSAPRMESFEVSSLLDDLVFPQLSTVLLRATTESRSTSSLTRLTLSELSFISRPAVEIELELKAFLKEIPTLEELEIDVSKKADREKATFCALWFIDLLGIQEGRLKEEGKEKGSIGLDRPVEMNEELEKGKMTSTMPVLKEPIFSPCGPPPLDPPSRPPLNNSNTPFYILPNLQHFTFNGDAIAMRDYPTSLNEDTTNDINNNDSESKHVGEDRVRGNSSRCSHYHNVKGANEKPPDFSRLLLEILSTRGGFGHNWLDLGHDVEPQNETKSVAENVVTPVEDSKVEPSAKEKGRAANSNIYILDDENNVQALPADVFTGLGTTSSSSLSSSHISTSPPLPLPVQSLPLNLYKRLASFTLKANVYGYSPSTCTVSNQTEPSSVSADGGNGCNCSVRMEIYKTGPGVTKETKEGLKRLAEEGGMKLTVVLDDDSWI